MNLTFGTEQITLLPEKVIVWNKTIILSDFHLGKTSHFRKQGIPLPASVIHKELSNLYTLIVHHNPERILFLGDLFHSDHNQEWEFFGELRNKFDEVKFELITGNHDILAMDCYQRYNITVHEYLKENHFLFTHEPWEEDLPTEIINFCGHIHPGFRVSEKKTQGFNLPCFFFYKNRMILPAYGHTTGLQLLAQKPKSRIFLVVKNSILEY